MKAVTKVSSGLKIGLRVSKDDVGSQERRPIPPQLPRPTVSRAASQCTRSVGAKHQRGAVVQPEPGTAATPICDGGCTCAQRNLSSQEASEQHDRILPGQGRSNLDEIIDRQPFLLQLEIGAPWHRLPFTSHRKPMSKIKLQVDALRVESFDTAVASSARGTVHARQSSYTQCFHTQYEETCAGDDCTRATLCINSCQMMCVANADVAPDEAA